MNKRVYTILSVIIASLLLMWYALYNGYPMVAGDTGAYVRFAFDFQVLKDRSPFYSVWLAFTGLRSLQFVGLSSLWFPVFFQCALVAVLLWRYYVMLACLTDAKPIWYLSAITIVAIATGAPFIAAYIMPDVFAGILLLAILLYLYDDKANGLWRVFYIGIIVVSLLVHNSHFLIVPVFCMLMLLYLQLSKQRDKRRKLLNVGGIAAACWLLICIVNYTHGLGFTLSPGSHVYMAGKLVETGTMEKYLDEQCAEQDFRLCVYKDQLPQKAYEYIWDEHGPFQKVGGWDSSAAEHNAIINDIFTTPAYSVHFIKAALLDTWQQLQFFNIAVSEQRLGPGSVPYLYIDKHLPTEISQFSEARQQENRIDNSYWIYLQVSVLALSLLWVGFLFVRGRLSQNFIHIYIAVFLYIICNAFVTASFANVLERLQTRIFWVLPATNLMVLVNYYLGKLR